MHRSNTTNLLPMLVCMCSELSGTRVVHIRCTYNSCNFTVPVLSLYCHVIIKFSNYIFIMPSISEDIACLLEPMVP